MKHWPILSVVLLCCALPGLVLGQGTDSAGTPKPARPLFRDYARECGCAFGGGCVASALPLAVAAGFLYDAAWGGSGEESGMTAICFGLAAYVIGSAAAANRAGNQRGWSGSGGWSLALAAAPAAGTTIAIPMDNEVAGGVGFYLSLFVVPALASIGYNIGATRREPRAWESRFAPPTFASRMESSPEPGRRGEVAFDAKLLSVRF